MTTIVVLVVGLFAVGIPALVRYTVQAVRAHRLANATTDTRPASCPSTGAGRGHNLCAVIGCETEATVHIYASDEWWVFCIEHGMPYLDEPRLYPQAYDEAEDIDAWEQELSGGEVA